MEEKFKGKTILERKTLRAISGSLIVILTIIFASVSLIAGGAIYLCFRPASLVMFRWIEAVGLLNVVESIRDSRSFSLPDWVVYSLPDGLWVYSYVVFMGWVWNFNFTKGLIFILAVPIIGIISEIAQLLGWLPGIFDWKDLTAYFLGTAVGILNIEFIKRKMKYEKV